MFSSTKSARKAFEAAFNDAFLFRRDKFDGWADWLEITSANIHQGLYLMGILEVDADAIHVNECIKTIKQRRDSNEIKRFHQLSAIVTTAIQEGHDVLGDLFQLLNLHNPEGQFFTPPDIARLMTYIGMRDIKDRIQEHGRITIADDACGSGELLLAAADYIESCGYNPKEVAVFEGTDVDRDCFNMAYIQLSMRGLQAVVRQGNTLTLEIKEQRSTPMFKLYRCWQWEMEQQQRKDQAFKDLFNLMGCASKVPFEPVPFMQWAVMPKSRLGALSTDWGGEVVDDGMGRDREQHNDIELNEGKYESTATQPPSTSGNQPNNQIRKRKNKGNKIDLTGIHQLNLFDL